jgi:hypothetical protein
MNEDPAFRDLVDEAECRFESSLVRAIADATDQDWRSAAWLLERRSPRSWGRTAGLKDHVLLRGVVELRAAEEGVNPDVCWGVTTIRKPDFV